jgi:hypothetical protein
MASTFSPLLGIELIGIGDQNNTWGTTNNTNLGTLIEQAIAGSTTIDVTAGNVTLTNFDGSSDQSRNAVLRITGTPGVSRNIIAPASSKVYVVANGSNAAVVLKTSVSTGLTVSAGEIYLAYYDTVLADFKYIGKSSSSANVAETLVLRDASGNFAAGTITAALTGSTTGAHNGTVGATTPNTGAFTTLSSTGNTTLGDASGDTLTVNATPTFNVAIPVLSGGTGVTTATGTGSVVRATSPTLVTPVLGTPSSGTLTNCTGLPLSTGISGTLGVLNGGTGVTSSTGSGSNVLSTSPTLVTPVLGTPSSGTLTNCTGLPISTGVSGLGTSVATALGIPVGSSGAPVVNGGALGTPTSGNLANCTFPTLNQNTTGNAATATNVTGVVAVVNGGTGLSSTPTNGALDIGNGTGFTRATLTAGTGITITNGSGAVTINSNGSTINSQSASYTAVAADAGKTIIESLSGAAITFNASIFNAGDIVSVVNTSAGNITVVQGASVTLRLGGTATTGTRTLASNGVATLICTVGGATPTFYSSGAGLT